MPRKVEKSKETENLKKAKKVTVTRKDGTVKKTVHKVAAKHAGKPESGFRTVSKYGKDGSLKKEVSKVKNDTSRDRFGYGDPNGRLIKTVKKADGSGKKVYMQDGNLVKHKSGGTK